MWKVIIYLYIETLREPSVTQERHGNNVRKMAIKSVVFSVGLLL